MKRALSTRNAMVASFVVLLLLIAMLWLQQRNLNHELAKSRNELQASKTQTELDKKLIYNEIDYKAQLQKLTVLPKENLLLLPEFGLVVPNTTRTRAMLYSYDPGTESSGGTGEVRLTTAYMTDHSLHTMSCNDMVRLKIEDAPNPYSPDQPHFATVTLSDNHKLQIYASTTKECAKAWSVESPKRMAEEFKNASLYY